MLFIIVPDVHGAICHLINMYNSCFKCAKGNEPVALQSRWGAEHTFGSPWTCPRTTQRLRLGTRTATPRRLVDALEITRETYPKKKNSRRLSPGRPRMLISQAKLADLANVPVGAHRALLGRRGRKEGRNEGGIGFKSNKSMEKNGGTIWVKSHWSYFCVR